LIDQTIVLPNGEQIMPSECNVQYITNPEKQIEEIFRRTQDAQDQTVPDADNTDVNSN